ncbi:MAG: S-adenosylmethionine decarboxylase [Gammaproteobacteria bacterium]|nr:S-adenosylmethionine decarboxylase [Gammaproteobacteria bacterium]
MPLCESSDKLRLHDFNNLSKTLSVTLYELTYRISEAEQRRYKTELNGRYSAQCLGLMLEKMAQKMGAKVLNLARQDYQPQGASATLLLSDALVAHLDKSHITIHTYPEQHPQNSLYTFRADIELSTCGRISPLTVLNELLDCFAAEVVLLDYRVRGFTRDVAGQKQFMDHEMVSIQNFLSAPRRAEYQLLDRNVAEENSFHTKMLKTSFVLEGFLSQSEQELCSGAELEQIEQCLRLEREELFYGRLSDPPATTCKRYGS